MIKAVANGSGGSTQFGIRAPWMAQRKFQPVQGSAALLSHYFDMIEQLGGLRPAPRRRCSTAPIELYQHCADMGLGDDNDVAVMIDVLNRYADDEKH